MMWVRVLLVALFACVALGVELDGEVYVLTTSNFDEFVNNEDFTVVEFYAPWCGHCKKLAPEWEKAAEALKDNNPPVKLAKVDATEEPDLASRFGVTGYPTIKIFRSGTAGEYKGPREAAGIITYVQKQSAPAITIIETLQDIEKFIEHEAGVVFFGDKSHKAYKIFESVAGKLREYFRFGASEAKEVLDKYNHKNQIVLVQAKRYSQSPLETATVVVTSANNDDEVTKFIRDHNLPLVGEFHADNERQYKHHRKPVVKVYGDLDWQLGNKQANYLLNKIRKVAKEYDDFLFAVASKSKNKKEYDDLALKGDLAFAIHDLNNGKRHPAPTGFSLESVKQHVDDYLAGKLENFVKSEPTPTQVEGEPVIVTGKTFDEIVLKSDKDVLLEVYAPWCGHCKTLEPKYKELAKKLSKYSDTLTIAKIDGTANDIPPGYSASGFPTVYFAAANKKNSPVKYDGPREVSDFVTYLKKNVHHPLKEKPAAAHAADASAEDQKEL